MRNDIALFLLVCAACAAFVGSARDPARGGATAPTALADSTDVSPTVTISKNVEEIRLVFTVQDRHGKAISGIGPEDLVVTDAGKQVLEFTSFEANSELPLRLGLLVDSSDSMRKGFEVKQRAAAEFLQRLLRPEIDRAFVVGFSATSQRKTSDEKLPALVELIDNLQAAGQTALYDAICNACVDEFMTREEDFPVRRILVLLTDGEDTQSRHNLSDVIAHAQRAEITVYAISIHSGRYEYAGDRILQEMASATGGRAFILSDYDQVQTVFAEIEAQLRSQYVLTYRRSQAPPHDGFHPVKVTPGKNAKHAKVSCRRGYYVEPDRWE